MTDANLKSNALLISERLAEAGYIAYWAGGCVRDTLLGIEPRDIDIATTATPDEILELFPKALAVGKKFGVIVVRRGDYNYDIATFRREGGYRDGRHPEQIEYTTPENDAKRRDFTVNGLFYDPKGNSTIDFVDGRKDIERGVIRAIGDPYDRFREDHLRMMRAIRFAATLDFKIEEETFNAIASEADSVKLISPERIRGELDKILLGAGMAGKAIGELHRSGLLKAIIPELGDTVGQEQPPQFHPEGDVFTHTCMMLDAMPEERSLDLAMSVLLHDIGKPPTARLSIEPDGSERIRFNRHAEVGSKMAESILLRLRYPKNIIKAVTHCIGNHMRFKDVQNMRPSKLRRLIGSETFPAELELHRLDCLASHGMLDNHHFLMEEHERFESEPALPAPLIRGNDLIQMGIPEGPEIGRYLKLAYDRQLEEEKQLSREELMEWIGRKIDSPRQ